MQQPSIQQFKQKYVEEVNDMLNDMEGSILTLEQDPSSIEEINQKIAHNYAMYASWYK